MKMKKTAIILVVALILGTMVPTSVFAADTTEVLVADGYINAKKATEVHLYVKYPNALSLQDANGWALYKDVQFDGDALYDKVIFDIGVENYYSGATLEMHLDALDGPVIASIAVQNTGSFETFVKQESLMKNTKISGPHDIYINASKRAAGSLKGFEFVKYQGGSTIQVPPDVAESEYETLYKKLVALDLIDAGKSDEQYKLNYSVKNLEVVESALKIMNEDTAMAEEYAKKWGVDLTERTVPKDLARIFVDVLGYSAFIKNDGDYMTWANKIKLFDDVDFTTQKVLKSELMKTLENVIDADYLDISGVSKNGKGVSSYDFTKDKDGVLNFYRSIKKTNGTVNGNTQTTLVEIDPCDDGYTVIENERYKIGDTTNEPPFGYSIEYYYKTEGSKKTLLYYELYDNKDVTIENDSFIDFSGSTISYYDEKDKKKTAALIPEFNFIYNGRAKNDFGREIFKNYKGYIKLIDNDNDGTYNTVIMSDTYDIVVYSYYDKVIVNANQSEYNNSLSTQNLDLSDATDVTISLPSGRKLDIDDLDILERWNIVTVGKCETYGKVYYDLVVNQTQVTSTVDKKYEKDGCTYLSILGSEYKLDKNVIYYDGNDKVTAGDKVSLSFNKYDRAVFVKVFSSEEKYGYLLNYGTEGSMDKKVLLKILSEDGNIYRYEVGDFLYIDSKREKKASEIINRIESQTDEYKQSLIRYSVREDGEITKIDFPYDRTDKSNVTGLADGESENSLYLSYEGSLKYKNVATSFSRQNLPASNAKVFVVPEGESDESQYMVEDISFFKNDATYKFKSYSYDVYSFENTAYVLRDKKISYYGISQESDVYYIDSIAKIYDNDEEKTEIFYYSGNEIKSIVVPEYVTQNIYSDKAKTQTESIDDFVQGDGIRFSVNSLTGEASAVQRIFNVKQMKLNNLSSTADRTFYFETVKECLGQVAVLDESGYMVRINTPNIYIYDKTASKNNKLRYASASEIADLIHLENGCKIMVDDYACRTRSILIIHP